LKEVQQAFCNQPISVHIAFREGTPHNGHVVGFAAYDANNRGTGWFGPMGTEPEYRGQGLGRVLLLRCLGDLHAQGRSWSTIPWVGPVGFYQQHAAAELDRTFVRLEKQVPAAGHHA
jgi:GNAT superfamily N-acetyltransferase